MSLRDPDWLPNQPNPWDAEEGGDCSVCGGSGDDPDVMEARGIRVDCPHCNGTGDEPINERDPHDGCEPGEEL
ncbi:MAG: hypothetical protein QM813_17130 [Verrucomicrobiota bacterium]